MKAAVKSWGLRIIAKCPPHRGVFAVIRHGMVLVGLFLQGCSAQGGAQYATPGGQDLRACHVVKHDWHVGIVVDHGDMAALVPSLGEDFPGADHLEIGWGDARYYKAVEPSAGLALRAVLWPTASVLHAVGFTGDPAHVFPASEVITLCLAPGPYRRLLEFIAATFDRGPGGNVIRLGPGLYGHSRFYQARGSFHAFNTCNTWTARGLAAAGLPVSHRLTVTAEGVMSQLRRDGGSVFPCP